MRFHFCVPVWAFVAASAIPCLSQVPARTSPAESTISRRTAIRLLEAEAHAAKAKAALIHAENQVQQSKRALQAYEEGDYRIQQQALMGEVFLAQEKLRRAEDRLAKSEIPRKEGQPKAANPEAEFACQQARLALEQARLKAAVLDRYTRPMTLSQLKDRIGAAQAEREAAELNYRLCAARLDIGRAALATGAASTTSKDTQGAVNKGSRAAESPGKTLNFEPLGVRLERTTDRPICRAKFPGGWLLSIRGAQGMETLAFYPDPAHEWDGSSLQ